MPDLHTLGHELEAEFKALSRTRGSHAPHSVLQRGTYLHHTFSTNWARLAAAARKERSQANRELIPLGDMKSTVQRLHDRTESFLEAAPSSWAPLKTREDWPQIRERVVDKVADSMPKSRLQAYLKQLGGFTKADLIKQTMRPFERSCDRLDDASAAWHAALVGSSLAQSVASFNIRRVAKHDVPGSAETWLRQAEATLQSHEKGIWAAVRNGDRKKIASASKALLRWIEGKTLDRAITLAAALSRSRLTPRNRWILGPQSLAAGELLRGLLFGKALGYRAAWIADLEMGDGEKWRRAAVRLPFPTRWDPPASLSFSALWDNPKRYNGKVVTVEGVVEQLANTHKSNKVYSSAWLFDRQGVSVRMAITHIKLDSGGLVEGAYAKVTGKFVAMDDDFGTPVIRVARRTLEEDAKRSWQDWTRFALRRVFTPVPHALAAGWSWEGGYDGACNQLRYGTWLPFEERS